MKKYILTRESKVVCGITLFRIQANISFKNVNKGNLGGQVQSESNLSQEGNAWVCGGAKVYGNARVYGDARVYERAEVYEQHGLYTGYINFKLSNIELSLKAQLGLIFIKNKVILYKRVNKIKEGEYSSYKDINFKYYDKKIAKVENPDLSNASCSSGIHCSLATYWPEGDTLIAVEVRKQDVITIQEGKVRCKQVKVIGEAK